MSDKKTQKQSILQAIKHTKQEMCKILCYSEDAYDIMRYELAIAWLQHNGFNEDIARILILSKSFFNWWYQQLNAGERIFIDYKLIKQPEGNKRDQFFEFILSLCFRPSSPVYESITKEGKSIIESNPKVKTLKIYTNVKA